MQDALKNQSNTLLEKLANRPNLIEQVLDNLGVRYEIRRDKGYAIVPCPICDGRASIRYENAISGPFPVFWHCFNENKPNDKKCQIKAHSSLIGYVRAVRKDDHPRKTVAWLEKLLGEQADALQESSIPNDVLGNALLVDNADPF